MRLTVVIMFTERMIIALVCLENLGSLKIFVKPRPNLQVLLYILLVKHACALSHHDKHCLRNTFCLSSFKNIFLHIARNDKQKLFVKHMFA